MPDLFGSHQRGAAAELNKLLALAREQGAAPLLLTVTFRHDRSMPLVDGLAAMKRAFKRFRQSRAWRAFGDQGR